MTPPLARGAVIWADLDPTLGREQSGTRPALVVSSDDYLGSVRDLVVVLPITTTDRGWPHHVRVDGSRLTRPSFAMTEQPRTLALERVARSAGQASDDTMREVDRWLGDFLGLRDRA